MLSTPVRLLDRPIIGAVLLFLSLMTPEISVAYADEWESREGNCFEWKGRWMVDRDQSGVWVGNISFVKIGGPCATGDHLQLTNEVRAVIVGDDFFARRSNGPSACMLHGRVQGEEVRGHELCAGNEPRAFALRLTWRGPEDREPEGREPEGRWPEGRWPEQRGPEAPQR